VYYTYILKSLSSERYYIGQTSDLELRLNRHNENLVKSAKNRGPWEIVYFEEYETRSEAMQRERYLKSLKSRKSIEELFLT
jgi:putative endonuclease